MVLTVWFARVENMIAIPNKPASLSPHHVLKGTMARTVIGMGDVKL